MNEKEKSILYQIGMFLPQVYLQKMTYDAMKSKFELHQPGITYIALEKASKDWACASVMDVKFKDDTLTLYCMNPDALIHDSMGSEGALWDCVRQSVKECFGLDLMIGPYTPDWDPQLKDHPWFMFGFALENIMKNFDTEQAKEMCNDWFGTYIVPKGPPPKTI